MITDKNVNFLARYGSNKHIKEIWNSDRKSNFNIRYDIAHNPSHSEEIAELGYRYPDRMSSALFIRKGKIPISIQHNIVDKMIELPKDSGVFGDRTRTDFDSLMYNDNLHHDVVHKIAKWGIENGKIDAIFLMYNHPNVSDATKEEIESYLLKKK